MYFHKIMPSSDSNTLFTIMNLCSLVYSEISSIDIPLCYMEVLGGQIHASFNSRVQRTLH